MAVSHARSTPRGSARRSKRNRHSGGGGILLLAVFLLVPATVFMLPMTVVFCLGMVPTVVAYVADRSPDKTAPVTVGAMNICGVLPFAIEFVDRSQGLDRLGEVLGTPATWLVMYGAAGIGWALYFAIPTLVSNFEVMRGQGRIDSLERKNRRLEEEWGGAVATTGGEDEGLPEPGEASKSVAETRRR